MVTILILLFLFVIFSVIFTVCTLCSRYIDSKARQAEEEEKWIRQYDEYL